MYHMYVVVRNNPDISEREFRSNEKGWTFNLRNAKLYTYGKASIVADKRNAGVARVRLTVELT